MRSASPGSRLVFVIAQAEQTPWVRGKRLANACLPGSPWTHFWMEMAKFCKFAEAS